MKSATANLLDGAAVEIGHLPKDNVDIRLCVKGLVLLDAWRAGANAKRMPPHFCLCNALPVQNDPFLKARLDQNYAHRLGTGL